MGLWNDIVRRGTTGDIKLEDKFSIRIGMQSFQINPENISVQQGMKLKIKARVDSPIYNTLLYLFEKTASKYTPATCRVDISLPEPFSSTYKESLVIAVDNIDQKESVFTLYANSIHEETYRSTLF